MRLKKWLAIIGAAVGVFLLIQLIPFGHDHTNPPVEQEVKWDRPQTRDLAVRACYDCHSNETIWPWYSTIAPLSWLVQKDVNEGRQRLNFSEWGLPQPKADSAPEQVKNGSMPPMQYVALHPSANLTPTEKAALMQGLVNTLSQK